MEGGEGWRMIRCEDKRVLNQKMLRFRPIAPKPVGGASGSVETQTGKSNVIGPRRRAKTPKRKYDRVKKNEEKVGENNKRVVTLQLLPEIEKSSDNSTDGGSSCCEFDTTMSTSHNHDEWLSLSKIGREDYMRSADTAAEDPAAVMGGAKSWVTVECVTGTCMKASPPHWFGIFSTDEERVRSLELDSCPGFVSDGCYRVMWLNGAFRRMVAMTWQMPETAVWLAMKEELPRAHSALTCQVKLRYTTVVNNKEKYCYSQMVPCDLWRIDGGGFAWRLDVKAALTLAVDAAPLHI